MVFTQSHGRSLPSLQITAMAEMRVGLWLENAYWTGRNKMNHLIDCNSISINSIPILRNKESLQLARGSLSMQSCKRNGLLSRPREVVFQANTALVSQDRQIKYFFLSSILPEKCGLKWLQPRQNSGVLLPSDVTVFDPEYAVGWDCGLLSMQTVLCLL